MQNLFRTCLTHSGVAGHIPAWPTHSGMEKSIPNDTPLFRTEKYSECKNAFRIGESRPRGSDVRALPLIRHSGMPRPSGIRPGASREYVKGTLSKASLTFAHRFLLQNKKGETRTKPPIRRAGELPLGKVEPPPQKRHRRFPAAM
jgi:hypothetical protein